MRLLRVLLLGLAALGACQRWGPNNPARLSDNPELQTMRDSRHGGLRTRCLACHDAAVAERPLPRRR